MYIHTYIHSITHTCIYICTYTYIYHIDWLVVLVLVHTVVTQASDHHYPQR